MECGKRPQGKIYLAPCGPIIYKCHRRQSKSHRDQSNYRSLNYYTTNYLWGKEKIDDNLKFRFLWNVPSKFGRMFKRDESEDTLRNGGGVFNPCLPCPSRVSLHIVLPQTLLGRFAWPLGGRGSVFKESRRLFTFRASLQDFECL